MPFKIKALKIYVYSPNLAYDIKLTEKQKDYDILTIDEFQKKYNFYEIIDEISENVYLLKNQKIHVLTNNNINQLLAASLNTSKNSIAQYISNYKNDWYNQYQKNKKHVIYDHNNKPFKSISQMATHYNIPDRTLRQRLANGYPLKEALTTPIKKMSHKVSDHLGNEYNSLQKMCKHYNINFNVFNHRKQKGWTLEQALTTPIKNRNRISVDHKGIQYKSIRAMCREYNVSINAYKDRIRRGASIQEALTKPVQTRSKNK